MEAPPSGDAEYTGPAFILPGAEVLLGDTYESAEKVGTTETVNVVAVRIVADGRVAIAWEDTLRLWPRRLEFYPLERQATARSNWDTRSAWAIQYMPRTTALRMGDKQFVLGANSNIFLRNACMVKCRRLGDPASAVLVPTGGANALDIGAETLVQLGWHRTSATPTSLELQKSDVSAAIALFLLLFGIIPGLLYALFQQGKPKILNVQLERVDDKHQALTFSGHKIAWDLASIVANVQDAFLDRL